MRKLAVALVVVAAIVVAWVHWRPTPVTAVDPPHVVAIPAPVVVVDAPASVPPKAIRHVDRDERQRLAAQIEAAHQQQHTAAPTLGSDDQMATPAQVLEQLKALTAQINEDVEACMKLSPTSTVFKADISLVGDPDIGTLVEATTPIVAADGTALPQAFSDCIRGEFQTLELPPMKTGDAYKVSFEIDHSRK